MLLSNLEAEAVQSEAGGDADLDALVGQVEARLQALNDALRLRDPAAVEKHAADLHLDLSSAVEACMLRARHGGVPESMRLRLASAGAQLARQREMLSRATAALDRAIEVLLPPGGVERGPLYGANGRAGGFGPGGGSVSA